MLWKVRSCGTLNGGAVCSIPYGYGVWDVGGSSVWYRRMGFGRPAIDGLD